MVRNRLDILAKKVLFNLIPLFKHFRENALPEDHVRNAMIDGFNLWISDMYFH